MNLKTRKLKYKFLCKKWKFTNVFKIDDSWYFLQTAILTLLISCRFNNARSMLWTRRPSLWAWWARRRWKGTQHNHGQFNNINGHALLWNCVGLLYNCKLQQRNSVMLSIPTRTVQLCMAIAKMTCNIFRFLIGLSANLSYPHNLIILMNILLNYCLNNNNKGNDINKTIWMKRSG